MADIDLVSWSAGFGGCDVTFRIGDVEYSYEAEYDGQYVLSKIRELAKYSTGKAHAYARQKMNLKSRRPLRIGVLRKG